MNQQSNNPRLPWIIAGVAVVGFAITLSWALNNNKKPPEATSSDAAMLQILARLDKLEAGSANGIRHPGSIGASNGGSPTAGRIVSPMGLGIDRQTLTPQQQAAERARELAALESEFRSDPADPVGGGKVESVLEKAVTSPTMAATQIVPEDVVVDCRSHSCRIVASFQKPGDAQDWALFYITAAGGDVLSRSRMVHQTRPDGSTEVRIFANRANR